MWSFYKILPYIKGRSSLIEDFEACFIFCISFHIMYLLVFPLKYCNVHIELWGHMTRKVMRHFDKAYGNLQRRQWHPTPVLLPGISHGRRSLVGCSPWGRQELGTTERLDFHFSMTFTLQWLSCIGEGNGNPLQCSCLENPRGRGAWWAVVSGVAQSWTRLKRLRSSNSRPFFSWIMGFKLEFLYTSAESWLVK